MDFLYHSARCNDKDRLSVTYESSCSMSDAIPFLHSIVAKTGADCSVTLELSSLNNSTEHSLLHGVAQSWQVDNYRKNTLIFTELQTGQTKKKLIFMTRGLPDVTEMEEPDWKICWYCWHWMHVKLWMAMK